MSAERLRIGHWALIGLSFAVPTSTALVNVFLFTMLFAFFLTGQYAEKWRFTTSHPFLPAVLLLVGVFAIGATYSIAPTVDVMDRLRELSKLLVLPIILWYAQPARVRQYMMAVFLIAMALTFILGVGKFFFNWPIGHGYSEAAVFRNHIKTNFFMAITGFLLAQQAVASPKWRRWCLLGVALTLFYGFFMSLGRTGYIIFAVLAVWFGFHYHPKKWLGLVASLGGMTTLVAMAFFLSDTFSNRLLCDLEDPTQRPAYCGVVGPSSLELRQDYLLTSWDLVLDRPFLGYGAGSFQYAYQDRALEMDTAVTKNPHNEYLRIMTELGLMGLAAFAYFFFRQWQLCRQMPHREKGLAVGLILAFGIGCLGNSWLMDFAELHCWMVFLGIAYATATPPKKTESHHHDLQLAESAG